MSIVLPSAPAWNWLLMNRPVVPDAVTIVSSRQCRLHGSMFSAVLSPVLNVTDLMPLGKSSVISGTDMVVLETVCVVCVCVEEEEEGE